MIAAILHLLLLYLGISAGCWAVLGVLVMYDRATFGGLASPRDLDPPAATPVAGLGPSIRR